MKFTIRKIVEQQVQLLLIFAALTKEHLAAIGMILSLFTLSLFMPAELHADIYRFVTIDGVETFTDAPSDKSAKVIIKDHSKSSAKQSKSAKKQKVHDISLDEIAQKAVSAALAPSVEQTQRFEPHLPPVGGTITSKVGMRIDPLDGVWRHHNGIDIAIPTGTPVRSVGTGTVVYSGMRSGYGNTVIVDHGNGIITLYAHNSRILVTPGQGVDSNTVLALSGSTGRSTGPHLHFEAWQSGNNVTMAFYPNSGITLPQETLLASSQRAASFRSEVLSDGSILFTNLPSGKP